MSLLMEALRKAEEAKRRMQQQEQASAASREAAIPPAASSAPSNAGSPFTLEDREDLTPDFIRDNFTTAPNQVNEVPPPVEAPPPVPAAEPEYTPEPEPSARNLVRRKQRAAAASVFEAKQNPSRNRKTLTILVIAMILIIPVGGGVLWYLQSAPSSSIGVNPTLANYDLTTRSLSDTPPATAAPAATAPQTAAVPPAATDGSVEPPVTAAAPGEAAAEEPAVAAPATPLPDTVETTIAEAAPAPALVAAAPAPGALASANPADAATEPRGVLEISRTRGTRQVNPDLIAAYESLQAGDLATAGRLYQQVLDLLPNSRDALLGLAQIHQRQNDPTGARELYARLLQLNPRDALAQTGLLQTTQVADAAEQERALKALVSRYPDVAQLTLALGNLYATQQRWSEAQGAYYNALLIASRGTGPVNPDYAFNLAVSLEQLNQPKAALDYYRQAQALARQVTPGFDLQQLTSRLAHLEQAQP